MATTPLTRALALLLFVFSGGCTTTATQTIEEEVPEIRPGILQGYLPMEDPLDSKAFVPPAPAKDSARQALDNAVSARALSLHGTSRWQLATKDADLHFPEAASTFSCALGLPISEAETPALYMLLRRTLADVGLATYAAKNAYQRQRPFMSNGAPICTPEDEETLRSDGSYPSGHTSIGWGWALILSQLAPERTEALLARGRAYGESRIVCNVHWYSDVAAGRMVAAGALARLQTNSDFRAAMAAAGEEVVMMRARELPVDSDCAAEAATLATTLH